MLEHFHAGDNLEVLRHRFCQCLGCAELVFDFDALFKGMQTGYLQGLTTHINTGNHTTLQRHGFGQDAAAATHIEDRFTRQTTAITSYPFQTQGV